MAEMQVPRDAGAIKADMFDSSVVSKEELIHRLFDIGAIQFGSFTLKSGTTSPIYLDMRRIISYPDVLPPIAALVWQQMQNYEFDCMCGVPYGALPIAMSVAVLHRQPMIMPRKEIKDHGTMRAIEGVYSAGQKVLIIEDIITSGASIIQTVDVLRQEGLKVQDVVVFLDREQGGGQRLAQHGIRMHAVCGLSYVIDVLHNGGKIDEATASSIKEYIRTNQCT